MSFLGFKIKFVCINIMAGVSHARRQGSHEMVLFAAVGHSTIPSSLNRHIGKTITLDFGLDAFEFGCCFVKIEVGLRAGHVPGTCPIVIFPYTCCVRGNTSVLSILDSQKQNMLMAQIR